MMMAIMEIANTKSAKSILYKYLEHYLFWGTKMMYVIIM